MPKLHLLATFRDAHGVAIETIQGPAEDVAAQAAKFMVVHGTDPDLDGTGAAAGSVEFEPVNEE